MDDTLSLAAEITNLAERLITGEATFLDLLLATRQHVVGVSGEPREELPPEVTAALRKLSHAALAALQREQSDILISIINEIGADIKVGIYGSKFFSRIG